MQKNVIDQKTCMPSFSDFISGAYTTFIYAGSFLGPAIMGVLIDLYGFRHASVFFFAMSLGIILLDTLALFKQITDAMIYNHRPKTYGTLQN